MSIRQCQKTSQRAAFLKEFQTVASRGWLSQISLTAPLEEKVPPAQCCFKNVETLGGKKTKENDLLFPNIHSSAPRERLCPQQRLSTEG